MNPRNALAFATLAAFLPASACTHYVRSADPPARVLATAEAHRARVWHGDASIDLLFPRVVGDSLVGWKQTAFGMSPGNRVALPLEDVIAIGTEEWDHAGTGMVLTGTGLLFYLTLRALLYEGT